METSRWTATPSAAAAAPPWNAARAPSAPAAMPWNTCAGVAPSALCTGSTIIISTAAATPPAKTEIWTRLAQPMVRSLTLSLTGARMLPSRASVHALDDDRRSHAAAGAHGHKAALLALPLQFVDHRTDQHRARRADRVAERDRAAVDVDLLAVEPEVANDLLHDDSERLVDLEEVDVLQPEAGLRQDLADRRARRVQHQGRAVAHVAHGDDARPRLQAVAPGVVGRGQQHRPRSVDHARRVARVVHELDVDVRVLLQDQAAESGPIFADLDVGHRLERRLQAGQALGGGLRPRELLVVERQVAVLVVDRHQALGEAAFRQRHRRAP